MKYVRITGDIVCNSGLHIGGSRETLEIGGIDLPVIKHPVTGQPYVPGSSLKGKMRSQLEKEMGLVPPNGEPHGCDDPRCVLCKTFGPHKKITKVFGGTRILVRDAMPKGDVQIELKTENVVNRKSGTAEHPRTMERVAEGARFGLDITLQLLDQDGDGRDALELVRKGLWHVEQTYLGASGSRGSGKVVFENLKLDGRDFDLSEPVA